MSPPARRDLCLLLFLAALVASGCCCPTSCPPRCTPVCTPVAAEDPVERAVADVLEAAREAEPAATALVLRLARESGGEIVGLEHRLKSYASTLSKLRRMHANEPHTAPADLVVYDALRYTILIPDEPPGHHDATLHRIFTALEAAGHRMQKVKNYWPRGDSYSGTNAVVVAPSRLPWELQLHTPASYALKQANHDDYERMRDPDTPMDEQRRLFRAQAERWEDVPIPDGILEPKSLHEIEELVTIPSP